MKKILITGANRGIGLEVVKQLDNSGHTIILCCRDTAKGREAIKGLSNRISVRKLDITDDQQVYELAESIKCDFGTIDVLINNAGISENFDENKAASAFKNSIKTNLKGVYSMIKTISPWLKSTGLKARDRGASDVPLDNSRIIMETNFYGPWKMIQAFKPLMSTGGHFINISSGMGTYESLNGYYPAYSLSKTALNGLTIMFSRELEKTGIRVNAVCPGWVRSDMGGPDAPRSLSQGADTIVWLACLENPPTGRFFRDREEIRW